MPSAELILASASARRHELLRSASIDFEVQIADVDETRLAEEAPRPYAERVAVLKAKTVADLRRAANDRRPVLGADTIVVIDGEAIGKPTDRSDARAMLLRLSGRTHQVITAFCIVGGEDKPRLSAVVTDVTFAELEPKTVDRYLDRASWQDKAGAYAIQEHAASMVRAIDGSYTNVVGLPLCEVLSALKKVGVLQQ